MRTLRISAAALAAFWATQAAAAVEVHFTAPEKYTDAILHNSRGEKARQETLDKIEKILKDLGEHYLTADDNLSIEVLDVDLAGRFEPWNPDYFGVRFMRSNTGPAMTVHYTYTRGSELAIEAQETISDTGYLSAAQSGSGENLPYETVMLDRWIRARFVDHRPAPN